jgi:Flp pilus assembly protein TadD
MCRKLALAATALALVASSAWAGSKHEPAPAATPAQQAAPVSPETDVPAPRKATAQERIEADRMDPLSRAAFWAHAVDIDARDAEAGVKLAKALRELQRFDDAVGAAERVLVMDPSNFGALMESARARVAAGQGFYAIDPAQRAAALQPRDWQPVSLLAVAFEQAQRDDEALSAHQRAVALAPANPAVLSNLGMYYATHGDAAQAEALLRRAAALPGATAQVRQNLALILGLQGKIAEAERLARQDLPPAVVANNLAYLKAAQTTPPQRSWDSLRSGQ